MSKELPAGWAVARLDAVTVAIQYGYTASAVSGLDGPRMLRITDIQNGCVDWSTVPGCRISRDDLKKYRLIAGDLVFARSGATTGKSFLIRECPPDAVFASYLIRVRTRGDIVLSEFLSQYFGTSRYWTHISDNLAGNAQPNCNGSKLAALEIPLPPLPEQRRIVEKVDALLERVNQAKARLDRVPLILKRFRQSVLAAACSGALTQQWRASNPRVVGADELLRDIARRRAKRGLPTATRPISDEAIEVPETELPETWTWCRVGHIADVRLGGTPSRKASKYWNGRIPWVSSGEVANCRISQTAERITDEGLENSNAKLYPVGTVLIAMIGEGKTRGQSALLDIEASTNQNVAGLVFDVGMIDPEYVWYWALQEYAKNRDEGRGGNQPALNGAKVRALPLPLPPLDEQREIVRILRLFLAQVDSLELRFHRAAMIVDRLPSAILSKAFAGELVPTEAELARIEGRPYETANELLGRLGDPVKIAAMNDKSPRRQRRRSA